MDVPDSEEAAEDGYIDNDGAAYDEDGDIGLGEVGVRTGVTKSGTEELEEVQRVVKYSSLSSFMLKPPYLLTQGLTRIRRHRKIYSTICVILGHEQSGGMG